MPSQRRDAQQRATPLPVRSCVMPAGEKDEILADATPYWALVGELNYLATSTRLDIAQAPGTLAKAWPTKEHWRLVLGVVRYLAGTRNFGLKFGGSGDLAFAGFSDSDWAGDPATRRSTSGFAFLLGGAAVSWSSQLQRTVAVSSAEAEWCWQFARPFGFAS
ncbi:hypothetical protein Vafri_21641 [Volvox africanus]|uniref:Retrovirus-related Pol polyprotein from transposon TNT 1-94 n=1 Tax=Volvox africanus TaxID=51714 RepID=A0A8J4BUH5_9CHLO|nr:hypothetical protein Vafri_21641 [Volvox africanus]